MRDSSSGYSSAVAPVRANSPAMAVESTACEEGEQSRRRGLLAERRPRAGLRADDQPAVGLSAVPERARRRRRQDHLVAGAGGAVSPERRADSEGSRQFRRIRRARGRLLRQGAAIPPAPDPGRGPADPRRPSWAPGTWASRSPTTPDSRTRGSRSPRCSTPSARRSASVPAAGSRSSTSARSGAPSSVNGSRSR